MTEQGGQLYRQVTKVTEEYLGPAAERFISRQVTYHLNKPPEELTRDDLPKLVEWAKISLGLLTSDQKVVGEYTSKLLKLMEMSKL